MAEDKLTILYNWLEEMTKAGDQVKDKYENEYKTIIGYVKTSETKERILAAQLISRFFKHFPAYEETAFDSIVDLCESGDVDVRKHATMAMIAICRDSKHLVSKAADILIQLYQTDQASEVNLINQSLMTLLNLDIQKFLQSFFTNFEDGTEIVRERALKFLSTKIHTVAETALTKEVEEQLLTYSKKAMEDVTKGEFITFVGILTKLKTAKTASGQSMIVSVIKSQAELNKEFDVNDLDSLDKFLLCTKHTIPLLSQYNRSSEYINYICLKILPHLKLMAPSGNDLNILQALAEMSPFVHVDDIPALVDLDKCQEVVYNKLLEYLPLPQTHANAKPAENAEGGDEVATKPATEGTPATETATEAPSNVTPTAEADTKKPVGEPDFQFTHIEYLIFTLHQFGKLKPELLTEGRLNDLKPRLQNLHLGCTKYMEILSAQLRNVKNGEELKKEENKIRSVALRTTKNISTLVKDLFKRPPQFKTTVLLSCKPLTSRPIETNPSTGGNKHSSNNNNNNNNANSNNNNNNNSNNRPPANKGHHQNNAGYHHRQAGQKYKQNYQGDRNKRARHAR